MYNKIKLCKGQYEYSDQDINRFLWEEQYTLKEILCSLEFNSFNIYKINFSG